MSKLETIKAVLRRWFPNYGPNVIEALANEMLEAVG